jgi:hypothetical protein
VLNTSKPHFAATSRRPHPRMKGKLEMQFKSSGLETTVILQPGLIVGGQKDRLFGQYVVGNMAG